MRYAVVAIALLLLLSWPLVTAADRPTLVLGVPLAYLYVIVIWVLTIIALAWIANRPRNKRRRHG